MDFNITENDKICTSCYNSHLEIIANFKYNSHDYELRVLLNNITPALTSVFSEIQMFGDILLRRVWGDHSQVKREERKRSKEREEREEKEELMEQRMHFCVLIIVVYHIM